MIFDAKIFVVLIFVVISFAIIFAIKLRTTAVIAIIIAHLMAVLFFSLSISNYNSFKEITLALVAYSMMLLFLISNHNPIFFDKKNSPTLLRNWRFWIRGALASIVVVAVFSAIFLVTKEVPKISKSIADDKLERQNEVLQNPMILPSHPVHIAVRKFYLGKKMESDSGDWVDKVQMKSEINERKQARLKDKLADNFLLKCSSDVILIIVAVSTSLLLLGARKIENNTENNS